MIVAMVILGIVMQNYNESLDQVKIWMLMLN
jgi:hypothetical protein